jgi:hypothetical protein
MLQGVSFTFSFCTASLSYRKPTSAQGNDEKDRYTTSCRSAPLIFLFWLCSYVTAGYSLISSSFPRTISVHTLVIFYDCSHFELDGALLSKLSDAFCRLVQTPRPKPLLFLYHYQQECGVKVMATLLIKLKTSTRIYRLLIFCSRNH